jgi:hypothetical protein
VSSVLTFPAKLLQFLTIRPIFLAKPMQMFTKATEEAKARWLQKTNQLTAIGHKY